MIRPAPVRRTITFRPAMCLLLGVSTIATSTAIATPAVGSAKIGQTVLRIARSKDGLSFKDNGSIFLRGASAPTIAQMKNGSLIVVVDYDSGDNDRGTVLSVTRSDDDGKSWSPLRPAKIDAPDPVRLTANHASFARTPGGRLQLFFASTPVKTRRSSPIMIFSAATRNGIDFTIDRSMRLGLPNSLEAHPMAVSTADRLHLFIERVAKGRMKSVDKAVLEHFVSPDGSDFARLAPARFEDLRFVGDVIAFADGYRAYVATPTGIASLISRDLRKWKREQGIRIARGWDPAVTKLKNGTFLMVYCARAKSDSTGRSSVVDTTLYGDDFDASDWPLEEEIAGSTAGDIAELADGSREGEAAGESVTLAEIAEAVLPALKALGTKLGELAAAIPTDWVVDPEHEDDWWDYWDPNETDGFAPSPDFETKVDYFSWYKEYLLPVPEDNAYDAYARFMPGHGPESPAEWPVLSDMFHTDDPEEKRRAPGPWKAKDHPDWAASNDEIQDLLEQFREASKIRDFAIPPHTNFEFQEGTSDDERLLLSILLPNLSQHRTMAKSTIADAWRVGADDKVSPERMQRAIETVLRAAGHMDQGQTLIEELVGIAQRRLIRDTARRAIEHDVFSADELEEVLESLQTWDQPLTDTAKGARAEHGFAMDVTQYLFSPPTSDGQPKLNRRRAETVMSSTGTDETWVEEMSHMTPDDVYASIDAFGRYYSDLADQIRIGYPDVRTADIDALVEENLHTSPLTEEIMPALSRYYQLKTRGETSRRATQLTYAVHLFNKRNGRWPASLDELPVSHTSGVRIDPFTGNDFKYELTDKGPRIYSLSENATDDGGKHSRRWGDRPDENGGSDDYVFWPPQPKK